MQRDPVTVHGVTVPNRTDWHDELVKHLPSRCVQVNAIQLVMFLEPSQIAMIQDSSFATSRKPTNRTATNTI
jgi:hypothetical protein